MHQQKEWWFRPNKQFAFRMTMLDFNRIVQIISQILELEINYFPNEKITAPKK